MPTQNDKNSGTCILFIPRFEKEGDAANESVLDWLSPIDESTSEGPAAVGFFNSDEHNTNMHYTPVFKEKDVVNVPSSQRITTLIDKGWRDEKEIYQILPDMASKDKPWPTSTDVYCWWCCFPFETRPVPIATHYHKGTFKVCGNFCSFNCAKAYLLKSKRNNINAVSLNVFMYKKMTGSDKYTAIVPAPPREMLKIFGGPFTIEKFRQASLELNEYKVLPFNCISTNEHIEESVRQAIRAAGVSEDGLPLTTSSGKRKRKNDDSGLEAATRDLDLRSRMEEAKSRIDTRQPKQKPVKSKKSKKVPTCETENSEQREAAYAPPIEPTPPVTDNASEYTLSGMTGLRIIRREKVSTKM